MSDFTVFPKNWKSKQASVRKNWYCRYRFYDLTGKVYQGYISGVNDFKTAAERKQAMQAYIDQEFAYLKAGYNPITKRMQAGPTDPVYLTWSEAIKTTAGSLKLAETTKRDLSYRIGKILSTADQVGFADIRVQDVKKLHIKQMLREMYPDSAYGYNKTRAYLMMIYKELVENDALEHNIIKDISKQKITRKIRQTLTQEEKVRVDRHLKKHHYNFWRYLQIFYHSQARSTELLQVRRHDVDLERQRFKILIKKGREYREEYRTITNTALPFWEDLMQKPGTILFSWGLEPGEKILKFNNITQNWWKWVKKPLNITADFYSIKHSATSDMVDALGVEAAAIQSGHTSTAMVVGIYDTKRPDREHERIKKAGNTFI